MNLLTPIIEFFGGVVRHHVGLLKLSCNTMYFLVCYRPRLKLIVEQIYSIGFTSTLLVVITGTFTGAVMAAQMYFAFSGYGLGSNVGAVVSITINRELAPVLAALMISGRAGTAIAAQIGNMKTNQQIDALHCMGVNPVEYLVVPRFTAMVISAPILTSMATACGLIASHMMAIYVFKIPAEWYGYNTWINTNIGDLLIGVIKAVFFGAVIVFVASEQGLNSKRGSIAVGEAIKASVVLSSIWIVVTNLFLSLALNQIFPLDLRAY